LELAQNEVAEGRGGWGGIEVGPDLSFPSSLFYPLSFHLLLASFTREPLLFLVRKLHFVEKTAL